jgi:hypothetical protein
MTVVATAWRSALWIHRPIPTPPPTTVPLTPKVAAVLVLDQMNLSYTA